MHSFNRALSIRIVNSLKLYVPRTNEARNSVFVCKERIVSLYHFLEYTFYKILFYSEPVHYRYRAISAENFDCTAYT